MQSIACGPFVSLAGGTVLCAIVSIARWHASGVPRAVPAIQRERRGCGIQYAWPPALLPRGRLRHEVRRSDPRASRATLVLGQRKVERGVPRLDQGPLGCPVPVSCSCRLTGVRREAGGCFIRAARSRSVHPRGVAVPVAPPPPRVEMVKPAPGPTYFWLNGRYTTGGTRSWLRASKVIAACC
jgi:hypothetical protein